MGKDNDLIRSFNEDGRKKREEDRLKTLLGSALKYQGKKKALQIDISAIVGLLTTRAEFDAFKKNISEALSKIDKLLMKLAPKMTTWDETADVLGRLLATLDKRELLTQDDIIETSRLIAEGQRLVKKLHAEHADKTLRERLEIMKAEGVDRIAVEEYEHLERKKAANRIVQLHKELRKPTPSEEGEIPKPKMFKEILEVMRAEDLPEEQVREYIFAFFPWDEGKKGADKSDDWYCPECDEGFGSQDCDGMVDKDTVACPKCGRGLFDAGKWVRPVDEKGKKIEKSETPETEEEEKEVVLLDPKEVVLEVNPDINLSEEDAEAPENKVEEDEGLVCPVGLETATGHYDPSGEGAGLEDDGFPSCAGCGGKRSEHNRAMKLVTPDDDDLDKAEETREDDGDRDDVE